jgi:acyl dehydratase
MPPNYRLRRARQERPVHRNNRVAGRVRPGYARETAGEGKPMPIHYLEDFSPGDVWSFEPWTLSENDIVAFAEIHDPQTMHTDPEAAAAGAYGGLIASGWQTALGTVTPFLREVMRETASLASPGFDTFKWIKPVRAGQPITPRVDILETRQSKSKPDRGIMRLRFSAMDDGGELVWEAEGVFMILCRPGT